MLLFEYSVDVRDLKKMKKYFFFSGKLTDVLWVLMLAILHRQSHDASIQKGSLVVKKVPKR